MLFVATRTIKKMHIEWIWLRMWLFQKVISEKHTYYNIFLRWKYIIVVFWGCFWLQLQKTTPRSEVVVSKTELQIERCDTIWMQNKGLWGVLWSKVNTLMNRVELKVRV